MPEICHCDECDAPDCSTEGCSNVAAGRDGLCKDCRRELAEKEKEDADE
jgi:hypothetical protein